MKRYIPNTKDDISAVEFLRSCSFIKVEKDVPELLRWMQDMHWDVSHGIAEYLTPYVNQIKFHLFDILNSNDNEWKFSVLNFLVLKSSNKLDPDLALLLKRISDDPTDGESFEELDVLARDIMLKNDSL